ncbi:MAG: TIGR03619 family F420-dependent LLM class oxidoreductase [Pseudomonadota bacterium]
MKLGVTLRNMGPQSSPSTMRECALAAEAAGFESIWITDHIAIPPDDAQGSGGRYTDTLTTLAWLAAATERIALGSGVLILPYRPALPTAKQIATVQELSGERLLLGVGIGWMDAEFRALGLDRHQRGRVSDELLAYLRRCFGDEVMTAHDQDFLFLPRPKCPPILIGGRAPHALRRAVNYGDGWLPMAQEPGQLAAPIQQYRQMLEEAGKIGAVTVMSGLPQGTDAALEKLEAFAQLGVERLVVGMRYDDVSAYRDQLGAITELKWDQG